MTDYNWPPISLLECDRIASGSQHQLARSQTVNLLTLIDCGASKEKLLDAAALIFLAIMGNNPVVDKQLELGEE